MHVLFTSSSSSSSSFSLSLSHSFRVVVHSKVNHSDYCTLSLRGMTRLREGKEAEFVELEQWITDYKHFHQLLDIKTFSKFRMWKAFSTWRNTVRSR